MKKIFFSIIISLIAIFCIGCEELIEDLSGCMLQDAPNYKSSALLACTTNCIGEQTGSNCCCEEIIYGCMDSTKTNYSDVANAECNDSGTDNDCCITDVPGCIHEDANNYNPLANTDDESCIFDQVEVTYNDENGEEKILTVTYGCMNEDACNWIESADADCSTKNSITDGSPPRETLVLKS